MTSLSRSGAPDWQALWSLPVPPEWASKVEWHKANVFEPSTYSGKLEGASAIVHSMGILIEEDYKGVLTGKEPIISGLKKAFDNREKDRGAQLTYESMNRDSGSHYLTLLRKQGIFSSSDVNFMEKKNIQL